MADSLEIILARHQAYLQRVSTHTGNVSIDIIDSLNRELKVDLVDWLDKNSEYKLTSAQAQQVEVLTNKIKATRGKAIDQATERLEVDMFDMAQREQVWLGGGLNTITGQSIATSSVSALNKMVTRTAFDGATIKQYYNKLSEDDSARIISTVQRGLSDGLTLPQITNSVFGSEKLGYTDGVLQTTRNAVMDKTNSTNAGIVRTTVNGVNNESKMMLYRANSDIISKVDYSITFDGLTSDVCVANSTKGINDTSVYKLGTEPSLPAHRNCRTYYAPVIDGFEDIESTKPAVTDTRTRKEREKDFRQDARDRGVKIGTVRKEWAKKHVKQVSDKLTFPQLLESDDKFARSWFGKTRYELWKNGDIPVKGFVDVKGKTLTIEELYAKEKDAFKKAKLNSSGKVLQKAKKQRTIKKEVVVPINKPEFRKQLINIEDKIYKRRTEKGYIFNKDGELRVEKAGTKNSVKFGLFELSNANGGLITHNHPVGGYQSFSFDDISTMFVSGAREIRATGDFATYSMSLKNGIKINEVGDKIRLLKADHDSVFSIRETSARKLLRSKSITKEEFNRYVSNGTWEDLIKNKQNSGITWGDYLEYGEDKRNK